MLYSLRLSRPVAAAFSTLVGAASMAGMPTTATAKSEPTLKEVVFAVVPQQSASRLAKAWVPTLTSLSDEIGLPVRFVTAKDIPTFERCLAIGAYHVAYMNPLHYVHFHKIAGYQAVAHRKGSRLKGIMVTRRESDIRDVQDLDGREIALPSPAAFGASVLPRAELRRRNITFTPKYVNSHDSVYRAVAAGLMPAGGGVMRTFATMQPGIKAQLEVFYTTNVYTPHAIAHRKDFPKALARKIQRGLVALGNHAPERLKRLGIKAFQAARDEDWDDVRELNVAPGDFDTRSLRHLQCL